MKRIRLEATVEELLPATHPGGDLVGPHRSHPDRRVAQRMPIRQLAERCHGAGRRRPIHRAQPRPLGPLVAAVPRARARCTASLPVRNDQPDRLHPLGLQLEPEGSATRVRQSFEMTRIWKILELMITVLLPRTTTTAPSLSAATSSASAKPQREPALPASQSMTGLKARRPLGAWCAERPFPATRR